MSANTGSAGAATLDRQGSQSDRQPSPVATLPRSARPARGLDIVAIVNFSAGAIEVDADGRIQLIKTSAPAISLAGVSFPVGTR